jgi:hypothetical protein
MFGKEVKIKKEEEITKYKIFVNSINHKFASKISGSLPMKMTLGTCTCQISVVSLC